MTRSVSALRLRGKPQEALRPTPSISTITAAMSERIARWFHEAQHRWPSVRWTAARFGIHVASESPNFPLDLYLSGAASEWIDDAWVAIHTECRPEVLRRVARIARQCEMAEDLWSEAVARLMAEDKNTELLANGRRCGRIRRFRGLVPLPSYLSVVAKRIALSRIRKIRIAMQYNHSARSHGASFAANPDESLDEREDTDRFARQFARAFAALTPLRQALLSLIYGPGVAKGEAGRLLGLRDYEVSRELKAALGSLRDQLELTNHDSWSIMSAETWARAWTEVRSLQEGEPKDEA
ncbi:MAG: sigma-70 family RNA polymerase sigma factor [Phycisphaerales bacterium]|nr:sigma-70 family RNA polymerase sigma factor [Phycisphaerales bacterium]